MPTPLETAQLRIAALSFALEQQRALTRALETTLDDALAKLHVAHRILALTDDSGLARHHSDTFDAIVRALGRNGASTRPQPEV